MSIYQDFKPSILFLAKFIGLYIVLNVLYGFYLELSKGEADLMTRWVTEQSAEILSWYNNGISTGPKDDLKSVYIFKGERAVLSVYEGCNGLNVMIIFISFLMAYGTISKKMFWFIPAGLLTIHLFNLARIVLLYHVTLSMPDFLYFSHKYLFTAFIYIAVFLSWALWIFKINDK
ncbi:exosortase/archaeosortase family protein [Marivirga lumbricoides]|uniref:Exosortase family protein XrtF n=1 Tax=Marivirga lumbricoides TaxID=1046115 RepID=A0A2T4DQ58_9BACT|nr:exosortase family protein XrtF [Marivirga lumbricoides]GGC44353.1 exosortase/archaeosortase family protein [Marivirga lumbricoides]